MMAEINFTAEQQAVLTAPIGNILVSASAGSGKTAVLTERILEHLLSGQTELNRLVVVTFTEAAAKQMKDKIRRKILAKIPSCCPDEAAILQDQMAYMPGADISTMHAFCKKIIKEFIYVLRDDKGNPLLDTEFKTLDGTEAALLLQQALDDVLNQIYVGIDHGELPKICWDFVGLSPAAAQMAFYRLLDSCDFNGDDAALRELLSNSLTKLRSLPHYGEFLLQSLDEYKQICKNFSKSRFLPLLLFHLNTLLVRAYPAIRRLESILQTHDVSTLAAAKTEGLLFYANSGSAAKIAENLQKDLQLRSVAAGNLRQLKAVYDKLQDWLASAQDDVDAANETMKAILNTIEAGRKNCAALALRAGGKSPDKAEFIYLYRTFAAEPLAWINSAEYSVTEAEQKNFVFPGVRPFGADMEAIEADLTDMLPVWQALAALLLFLDQTYASYKLKQNAVDFGDMEHYALRILENPAVREYCQNFYQEVYVDEYQDTSSIQESILQALSKNNVFRVGDIKQSIYRFRYANPDIFAALESELEMSTAPAAVPGAAPAGRLLRLNNNYRSVPNILGVANFVFSRLMNGEDGEIDYRTKHQFVAKRETTADPRVKVIYTADGRGDDLSEAENESLATDELLRKPNSVTLECVKLVDELRKDAAQGIAWEDVAILVRRNNTAAVISKWLERYGIPVEKNMPQEWYKTSEVLQVEALLQLIDNRRQDYPLLAVLRSNLHPFGFTENELVAIRLYFRQNASPELQYRSYFHTAVEFYLADSTHEIRAEAESAVAPDSKSEAEPAAAPDSDLKHRLREFFHWLATWRSLALSTSVPNLIAAILQSMDLPAEIKGEELETRQQALDLMLTTAYSYNSNYRHNLREYLKYLEEIRLQAILDSEKNAGGGVKLMTYHGSKGLEFPIVYLLDLGCGRSDCPAADKFIIDDKLGLAGLWIDPNADDAAQSRRSTPLMDAEILAEHKAEKAEQIRLLYVAMTRAKDSLRIITAFDEKIGEMEWKKQPEFWQSKNAVDISDAAAGQIMVNRTKSHADMLNLAFNSLPNIDRMRDLLLAAKPFQLSYGDTSSGKIDLATAGTEAPATDCRIDFVFSPVEALEPYIKPNTPANTKPTTEDKSTAAEAITATEQQTTADQLTTTDTVRGQFAAVDQAPILSKAVDQAPTPSKTVDQASVPFTLPADRQDIVLQYQPDPTEIQPAKTTVTILSRESERSDEITTRETSMKPDSDTLILDMNFDLPEWPTEKMTGAERGTLLHRCMRKLDFTAMANATMITPAMAKPSMEQVTIEKVTAATSTLSAQTSPAAAIDKELERQLTYLRERNIFTEREYTELGRWIDKIRQFFLSDLFRAMLKAEQTGGNIFRETPFTMNVPDDPRIGTDVIVQGQIDLWFTDGRKNALVDYKTDCLKEADPEQQDEAVRKRYAAQLNYYAKALEQATGLPTAAKIIWLLRYGRAIYLE